LKVRFRRRRKRIKELIWIRFRIRDRLKGYLLNLEFLDLELTDPEFVSTDEVADIRPLK